jgi:hypothetical protein
MNSIHHPSLFRSAAGALLVLAWLGAPDRLAAQGRPAVPLAALAAAPAASAAPATLSRDEQDRETDKQHLRLIYQAIQAYRQKHGELPGWLSDLVPEFLPDTNVLMSPVELRTGRSVLWGFGDPKVKSSYIYEFNQASSGRTGDQDVPLTMKQWKTLQMEEFGPVVPMLRCHLHDPILNVSYSGDLYETSLYWESDTNTLALMARLGTGPGAREGKKLRLTVLDAASGQRVPAAAVDASNRQSEFGPLPPRHLTTDAKGQCEVNLGGNRPTSLRLQVTKAGFARAQAQWNQGELPDEWSARLTKATTIGGVVKDPQGRPVPGVAIVINGFQGDQADQEAPTEFDSVVTDAAGKWSSHYVPARFERLNFKLSHPEFMPAEFDQAATDTAAGKAPTKPNLLAGTAELQVQPGTVVEGKVQDEKGQPVARAQVDLRITENNRTTSRRAETSDAGRFRFVVTTTGNAALIVEAAGLAPASLELDPLDGQPSLPPVSLTLPKGRKMEGRVLDAEDQPVEGATVAVSRWNNLAPLEWRTVSDAQGRFTWNGAPSEPTVVQVSKTGFRDSFDQLPPGDAPDWRLRLYKPATLSGSVLDPEGKPAPKATICFFPRGGFEQPADADGRFSLTATANAAGEQRVLVAREKERNLAVALEIEQDAGKFTLKLEPALTLVGRVTDDHDQPVTNAEVGVIFWTERSGSSLGRPVRADAQGRFEVNALPKGYRYGLNVSAKGYGTDSRHDLETQDASTNRLHVEPFRLPLANLRLAGVVTDADDKPVAGATVTSSGARQPLVRGQTDAKGQFSLEQVCAGPIRVSASSQRGSTGSTSAEGGDTNVTIQLVPRQTAARVLSTRYGTGSSLKLSGSVLDPDGKPAPRVTVNLFPFSFAQKRTDAEGRFTLTGDSGPFFAGANAQAVVIARDSEHNLAAAQDVEEDATNATLRLGPAVTLAGRVADVNGHVVSNAQYQLTLRTERLSSPLGQTVRVGADGCFEIKALPLGRRYGVTVTARGFGQAHHDVDAPESGTGAAAAAQRLELETFELQVADQRLAGQVVDQDEKPVVGAFLTVFGNQQPSQTVQTDNKGRFSLANLCPGTVRLSANDPRGNGYGLATAEAGETNVVIRLGASSSIVFGAAPQRVSLRGKHLPDLAPLGLAAADVPAGQPVLVALIDAEQRPSRRALRQLTEQAGGLKAKGLAVVVLQAGAMADADFAAWKQEAALPFPVARAKDEAEKTQTAWGASALPWFVLADKSHRVAAEGFPLEDLDAKVKDLKD